MELLTDWPGKYISGQSAGHNLNNSGTGLVRVSAQQLFCAWSKFSPKNIASSQLAGSGCYRKMVNVFVPKRDVSTDWLTDWLSVCLSSFFLECFYWVSSLAWWMTLNKKLFWVVPLHRFETTFFCWVLLRIVSLNTDHAPIIFCLWKPQLNYSLSVSMTCIPSPLVP